MGQYYMPLIINGDNLYTLESHDFDSGSKLTEHSWIGNHFVNAVLALIKKQPKKVAWIGDYSNNPYDEGDVYAGLMSKTTFQRYYDAAWEENTRCQLSKKSFTKKVLEKTLDHSTKNMYLVNHRRHVYIDLAEYILECTVKEGAWEGYCLNPLPLLTACGNDRGGGDFRSGNTGYDDIGIWAFDTIEYTDTIPENFEKVQFQFFEDCN